MVGGGDVLGGPAGAKRRGRPKGALGKKAKDLRGYIDAKYGGSAALQSAQLALVTPAELKAAGGSMARAQVSKALDLVQHVRQAQDGLDDRLRQLVREEVEYLLLDVREAKAEELRKGLAQAIKRAVDGAGGFGLREALKILSDERANLLPYTDQRQPLAIETKGAMAPSVVIMDAGLSHGASVEKAEVLEGAFTEVAQSKSHDDGQAVEPPQLFGPAAAD